MEKSGKFRLTSLERNWILYDVGNSAFVLMVATLIPIFFNALAAAGGLSSVEYLAYWGYASSAVTIITAVLSPILGTVADTKGFKKPIFILCVFVGIVGCCAMGAASAWLPFLVIFVIAKVGFSGSLVFYDSMLSDVTTPERMAELLAKVLPAHVDISRLDFIRKRVYTHNARIAERWKIGRIMLAGDAAHIMPV